jgi:hypothetical protein
MKMRICHRVFQVTFGESEGRGRRQYVGVHLFVTS